MSSILMLAKQRLIRKVDLASWPISATLGSRVDRLHSGLDPASLVARFIAEASTASNSNLLCLAWEDSCERPGFGRISARIPLTEETFDQLFNGRSGYRAQYYLSPEEGVLFNRDIVTGLFDPVENAYRTAPLDVPIDLVGRSLLAPHSKIWIFEEKAAFDDAEAETLNPPRWVAKGATRGRKAPLPSHFTVDLKGAFLLPASGELFVDDLKLDRPYDLFNKGYT